MQHPRFAKIGGWVKKMESNKGRKKKKEMMEYDSQFDTNLLVANDSGEDECDEGTAEVKENGTRGSRKDVRRGR